MLITPSSIASNTDGTILYVGSSAGVYKSINSGIDWTLLPIVGAQSQSVNSVTCSTDGTKVTVSTNIQRYCVSLDSGNNWIENTGFSGMRGKHCASADGVIVYVWSAKLSNYGLTFDTWLPFFTAGSNPGFYQPSTSANGQIVLVDGDSTQISTTGGASWNLCGPYIADQKSRGTKMSDDGSRLFAKFTYFGDPNYSVGWYISTNSGAEWSFLTSGINIVAINYDGTKLLGIGGVYNDTIFTSTNSGTSWTEQSFRLFDNTRSLYFHVVDATTSPDGSKMAIIDSQGQVYMSNNFGVDWTTAFPFPTPVPSYYSYYSAIKLRCRTVFNSSVKFLDPLRYNS
jgi:photosystem II stability/assembly factor-like uncharacterized protein